MLQEGILFNVDLKWSEIRLEVYHGSGNCSLRLFDVSIAFSKDYIFLEKLSQSQLHFKEQGQFYTLLVR